MPMISSALPEFAAAKAWPFAGIDSNAGWADRLLSISLAPNRANANTGAAMPNVADLSSRRSPSGTTSLTAALAGIVVIAAQRALAAGEFPKLREAIDRALHSVLGDGEAGDPREDGMGELPRIGDIDLRWEMNRLSHLMRRQATV